jgi:hypothetical protein
MMMVAVWMTNALWVGAASAEEPLDGALAPYADSPPPTAPAPAETEVRNPGLIGGGAVLLAGGVAGGIALAVHASSVESSGGFMDFSGLEKFAAGFGAFVCLGGGLGGGITMIALGARRVPASGEPEASDAPPTGPAPRIGLSPTSVTMEWSF